MSSNFLIQSISWSHSELYNNPFRQYYDEYYKLSAAGKNNLDHRYRPINLKLEDYDVFFTKEEWDDKTLEGDKKKNLIKHKKMIKRRI